MIQRDSFVEISFGSPCQDRTGNKGSYPHPSDWPIRARDRRRLEQPFCGRRRGGRTPCATRRVSNQFRTVAARAVSRSRRSSQQGASNSVVRRSTPIRATTNRLCDLRSWMKPVPPALSIRETRWVIFLPSYVCVFVLISDSILLSLLTREFQEASFLILSFSSSSLEEVPRDLCTFSELVILVLALFST